MCDAPHSKSKNNNSRSNNRDTTTPSTSLATKESVERPVRERIKSNKKSRKQKKPPMQCKQLNTHTGNYLFFLGGFLSHSLAAFVCNWNGCIMFSVVVPVSINIENIIMMFNGGVLLKNKEHKTHTLTST